MELSKDDLHAALELALQNRAKARGNALSTALRPIIFTNLERGRIQEYFRDMAPEEYVERVVVFYERQHPYISKLLDARDNDEWTKLCEVLNKKAYHYYVSYGQPSQVATELAEESANEAASRLFTTHFPYDLDFWPWMYTLLRFVCIARLKAMTAHPSQTLTDFEETLTDSTVPTGRNLERKMAARQEVLHAIGKLGPNRQQVILLHYYENYSFPEIAQMMDKSINAIHQLHLQARRDLENILRQNRF
ncbi:MAG: sigma-70 family RNA polymerase sigma factor [Anaerolineales bacterium]|nr:sigma-70 family RNA polymerase sigma factor [Anaerolineales bacterium]